MYHAIVRRVAKAKFAQLDRRELDGFETMFDDRSLLRMYGEHALGGEIIGRQAVRSFFERLFAIFPDITIEPVTFVVAGWPWKTIVATRFQVRARLADGSDYANEGMQYLELRWGTVVQDRLYEDTLLLAQAIQVQRDAGFVLAPASAGG